MSHWIIELKRGSIEGDTLREVKEKFLNHCLEEDFPFDIEDIFESDCGKIFSQPEVKKISDEIEREYWNLKEDQNELTPNYY